MHLVVFILAILAIAVAAFLIYSRNTFVFDGSGKFVTMNLENLDANSLSISLDLKVEQDGFVLHLGYIPNKTSNENYSVVLLMMKKGQVFLKRTIGRNGQVVQSDEIVGEKDIRDGSFHPVKVFLTFDKMELTVDSSVRVKNFEKIDSKFDEKLVFIGGSPDANANFSLKATVKNLTFKDKKPVLEFVGEKESKRNEIKHPERPFLSTIGKGFKKI